MPFNLFATLRARGWGFQSEQQVDAPLFAANTSVQLQVVPAAPYEGIIVHLITFWNFVPNAFQVRVWHEEVGDHTVLLSEDLAEVGAWIYVSANAPLNMILTNRLAFPGFIGATLATINFRKLADMMQVKEALEKESLLTGADLPAFVPRRRR